ncbi:MAG: DNA gyrase subunit A [Methylocystis sp.]
MVVTEIPYGVQKSRLIERCSPELIAERKLPLVADVRDESAEDVRIDLRTARAHRRSGADDGDFVQALRTRNASMNMNVLVDGVTPRVVSLDETLRQWLDHRRVVLQRRSRHRLAAIIRRIEQLEGMIIVFLNLDEVIRIIREEDDAQGGVEKKGVQAH